jgi:cytochrome c biogenesis protein CcdA
MHYFSALFGNELYMFRTDLLSIIMSLNTVFTAVGICYTGYVAVCYQSQEDLTSVADIYITSMTKTNCCEYSIKTPDDGQ